MKNGSFADGLRAMDTRGALVQKVRLTPARKDQLRKFVREKIGEIATRFPEKGTENDYCAALKWIADKIDPPAKGVFVRMRLTPKMASWLVRLVDEQRLEIESLVNKNPEDDFCAAMQWIVNQYSKRWSRFELCRLENKKNKRV